MVAQNSPSSTRSQVIIKIMLSCLRRPVVNRHDANRSPSARLRSGPR